MAFTSIFRVLWGRLGGTTYVPPPGKTFVDRSRRATFYSPNMATTFYSKGTATLRVPAASTTFYVGS